MFKKYFKILKNLYPQQKELPLHQPCFISNEKELLNLCIESGFVSSVGGFVAEFEEQIKALSKSAFAIAMNSGTSALHIALLANGIGKNDEVLTQSLSFVATANAIAYTGAKPIFLDIHPQSLSLSPEALRTFLEQKSFIKNKKCFNKNTKKQIKALILMHSFGLSGFVKELKALCEEFHLLFIEDAAEALGSTYENKALGSFGKCGIYSFNGNKIITGGCGGILISDDENLALKARHLSTTAKLAHNYEYEHDELGYNYRLCNINAALLIAQLQKLDFFLVQKRALARYYKTFFNDENFSFVDELQGTKSNFWLNTIIAKDEKLRHNFIEKAHKEGIFLRGAWKNLALLPMYKTCENDGLKISLELGKRIINLPSSAGGLKLAQMEEK